MIGDDPVIDSGELETTGTDFQNAGDCFVPFVDIAPYEYELEGSDPYIASVLITYTQFEDDETLGAVYAGMPVFELGVGPEFHYYYIGWDADFDEGLPQIAVDATGTEYDARFIYLRGDTDYTDPFQVYSAETNWEVWEQDEDDGVDGQNPLPDDDIVSYLAREDDTYTPSIALCLEDTYWAVWTDERDKGESGQDVYTNYWEP
jgi:hypothetical protein